MFEVMALGARDLYRANLITHISDNLVVNLIETYYLVQGLAYRSNGPPV